MSLCLCSYVDPYDSLCALTYVRLRLSVRGSVRVTLCLQFVCLSVRVNASMSISCQCVCVCLYVCVSMYL